MGPWWAISVAAAEEGDEDVLADEPVDEPRGSFGIGAGLAAGRIGDEWFPVYGFGAEIRYDLGRRRRAGVVLDTSIDLGGPYASQQLALGGLVTVPFGRVTWEGGPRLWVASMSIDGEPTVLPSPGASFGGELALDLGRDWSLFAGGSVGRGLSPAWSTIGRSPLTHASGQLGIRLPIGLGIGFGASQVGDLSTGLTTLGAAF